MNIEDVKKYMIQWNRRFPIDRWWREKHKIAFLSKEHKESSFLDQLKEFEEEVYFYIDLKKQKDEEETYIPNIGEYFKDTLAEKDLENEEVSIDSIEEFRKEAEKIRKIEQNGNKQED